MATNETYEQLQSGDPLEKLYKVVKQQGLYTKSFDEFKTKYSDRANRERLYNVIREQGLYTKSQEEFNRQYFAASEIPPLDITKVPREKAVSESTAIPKGMPRELDMSKLHKDYEERYQKQKKELTKKAVQSHEVLKNELLGNEDVLTELIQEGRYRRHVEQQLDQFAAGPRSDMPRVLPQRPEDFVNINPAAQPISEEEKIETKTAILSDPNRSRSFLKSVAAKKPEKAKEIQEAMYIADRADELPEDPDLAADYKNQRVLKNLEGIRKGEIRYDVTSGTLQKPVSFFDAVVHGWHERIRQLHGYDFANKATDQELIEHFEKQRTSYDPDKPIPVYEGAASFGQMVGAEGMPMLKGGTAAVLAGAATGGFGATVAAAAINTPENYQRGYYTALEETYNQLRNEGKSPEEALQVARAQARDEGKLSAIEGIVSSAVGARWGMKSLPKPRITGGFLNATKNAILESGKFLKDITLEGLGEGLVAGYIQTEKNIKAQEKGIARMEDEGVTEAITGEIIFSLGVAGITQAGRVGLKSTKAFKNLLYHVARQPQETIDQQLDNMVTDGLITQEDAEQTRQEILQQKQLDNKVPDNIRDESRQKIIEKIQQREALREQLEKTDEALQEPVRQKIEKINEEIIELSKDKKTREELKAEKTEVPQQPSPKPFPQPEKELTEMNSREIEDYSKVVKDFYKNQEKEFFGIEGAKKYKQAQSVVNSMNASQEEVNAARRTIEEMESALSQEQYDALFGIGQPRGMLYDPLQIRELASSVRLVEESENVNELAKSLKLPLLEFAKDQNNVGALAIMNAAKKRAEELGVNPEMLIRESLDNITKDLNKADADFLGKTVLEKLLKPTSESIQVQEGEAMPDAATKPIALIGEITTPEQLEAELDNLVAEQTEPEVPATKPAVPEISPEQQEQADYAYQNTYRFFKQKYPDIDVDEYNRLRSVKKRQTGRALPKLGEINAENNLRPANEDVSQYTPKSILEKAGAFYKGDALIERVIDFLTPIIEGNPNIRIDTKAKVESGVLGYSYGDGRIELNFDAIADYDTLYRTALHELVHAATRNEIASNQAFKEDLSLVLDDVRKAMKLPDNGAVISAFVARGIIDENKYGASNEYELLAEVFTNQKFYEALKNLEYKGDSVLRRIFLAIAKFFSEKYRQITQAKEQISVDNIADYLMALTESVVSAPEQSSSTDADALPLIKPVDQGRLKSLIRNTTLPDEQLIPILVNKLEITEQEAQNLIDEARATQLPKSAIPEVPNRPQPYKSGFKKFRDKWFSSAAGLPNWILPLRDHAEGSIQLEVRRALQVVKKLKKEAAKHKFDDWEAFDNALRGDEEAYTQLPEIIQPFVVQMRAMIDGLSYQLITGGFVSQEQALNIESNIGTYLTRSYKIFNEKNWAKEVPRNVRNEAYRLLVQDAYSLIKEKNPDIDDQEAIDRAAKIGLQELEAILAGKSEKFDVGKSAVRGKDLGILKQRKEIPKEIRDLLGEYKDPGLNFALTIARVASLKSQAEFLTKVRGMGMGTIFFKKDDVDRPAGASVPIAAEGSETWSPLNGLYTYPEVKEAFKEVEKERNFLVNAYMKAVGAVRWGKTVGSIVTQVKNFESNVGFAIMNGHYRAGKAKQSWKYLKDKLIKGEKSTDELIEKAIRLGLVGQSVGMRELKAMFQSDDIEKIALTATLKEKTPIRKITNRVAKPISYLNKVYGASDDFWKIYGFLNEAESLSQARYEKSYKDLSPEEMEQIDLEASERTKATYPTYDRVVPGAKVISKYVPIFGNFISFQAEVVRNLYNTISYVKNDLKDPQLRPLGIQRLLGITAYMSARVIALHAIAQMTGVGMAGLFGLANDDEEQEKLDDINRYVPSFMRSGDKLVKDHGDGTYTVYDIAALDPYGVIFRTMNAISSGGQEIEEPGPLAAISEFLNPFTEYEILFGAWIDIEKNQDWRGRRVYNPADPMGEQFIDKLSYLLEMAKPSTIGFFERLFNREDKANEIAAMFGGRGYTIDMTKGFATKLRTAQDLLSATNEDYYRGINNPNATDEEIEKLETQRAERLKRVTEKLHKDYQAALRLGADPVALDEILDRKKWFQGYDRKVKETIRTGIMEE